MMEYWVNTCDGMPFFFVTAEVNERMIEMLEGENALGSLLKVARSDGEPFLFGTIKLPTVGKYRPIAVATNITKKKRFVKGEKIFLK